MSRFGYTSLGFGSGASAGDFENDWCVNFDGTNDAMDVGNTSDFNFTSASTFTLSLWVNFDAINSVNRLIYRHNGGAEGWNIYTRSTTGLSMYTDDDNNFGGSFSTGTWYHLALVYNATSATFYLDGSSVATKTVDITSTAARSMYYAGTLAYFFDGRMDELSIFDSALSGATVSSIYNGGTPTDLTSLSPVNWWRMGDIVGGSGTNIPDQGSDGHDGTLVNGPTFSSSVP